jgi:hypothetical protein
MPPAGSFRAICSGEATSHGWLGVLPDGKSIVFCIWTGMTFDAAPIGLLSLSGGSTDGIHGRMSSSISESAHEPVAHPDA